MQTKLAQQQQQQLAQQTHQMPQPKLSETLAMASVTQVHKQPSIVTPVESIKPLEQLSMDASQLKVEMWIDG